MQLFLAEDNLADRMLFRQTLDEIDVTTRLFTAVNAKEAIRKLNDPFHEAPDIIFLDLIMPFHDALECLNVIRSNRKFDRTPVIILSGTVNREKAEQAYRMGANLYILKQYCMGDDIKILKEIFRKGPAKLLEEETLAQFVIGLKKKEPKTFIKQ
jgi:CheY-like chemotaxis protein